MLILARDSSASLLAHTNLSLIDDKSPLDLSKPARWWTVEQPDSDGVVQRFQYQLRNNANEGYLGENSWHLAHFRVSSRDSRTTRRFLNFNLA